MKIILDACALISYFRDEHGADNIEEMLLNEKCFVLSTNWAETHNDFVKRNERNLSKIARDSLVNSGVGFIEKLSVEVCELAAELKGMTVGQKHKASYCDCFAIAYAKLHKAKVVTSDGEFSFFKAQGFPIEFFRPPYSA